MATVLGNQVSAYHDSVMHASGAAVGSWDMLKPAQEAILTAPGVVASISAVLRHPINSLDARDERLHICESMLRSMSEVMRSAEMLLEHEFEPAGLPEFHEAMTRLRSLIADIVRTNEPTAAQQTVKYRSPAAALDPWEYTDEGAALLRQIMDPANPVGKAIDQGAPVAKADASVIRRRHS